MVKQDSFKEIQDKFFHVFEIIYLININELRNQNKAFLIKYILIKIVQKVRILLLTQYKLTAYNVRHKLIIENIHISLKHYMSITYIIL